MNSCTDTFMLNSTKLFEEVRSNLPKHRNKTENLIESLDDILFAWNSAECNLLAINWRAAKLKGNDKIKYQKLLPSVTQNFNVEKIIASPEGSMICLAGSHGLSVMELPKRWGPNGQFLNGKEIITCKAYNLDEQFYLNNNSLELYQVRWHPGSPTDSHLLTLLSNNTIRVYNEASLRHIWKVGPIPEVPLSEDNQENDTLSNKAKDGFPTLFDMGETAVDFDIAPARVVTETNIDILKENANATNKSVLNVSARNSINDSLNQNSIINKTKQKNENEKVEWPIIILRGNGNIYVLNAGIETGTPKLQGPLTFFPQCDDNYGVESCSLIVIPSLPPTIVVAESNGNLHHGLLIESECLEESFNEIDSSLYMHPCEWTINVLETVKLELGLTESNQIEQNLCPIHLKRDTINELRYFAYHNAGLHAVVINFIRELQRFVESENIANDINLNSPSNAEYIVCTKVKEDNQKINPVLGCTLLHMPSGIVLLLGSGEVISLNVIIDPSILVDTLKPPSTPPSKNSSDISLSSSPVQKIMKESFVLHIANILKRTVSQPILSLDKNADLPPDEMYKILSQSIITLKEQYFRKHEKARTEILRRVKILKLLKEQQQKEIENLECDKNSIRTEAERLAARYEEIYEKQQSLSADCQELIRQANIKIPNNNMADAEFKENVQKISEATKKLSQTLQQVKANIKKQQYHINKYTKETENKKIVLPAKQETLMKEILSEITKEVDTQIKDIKRINNVINM